MTDIIAAFATAPGSAGLSVLRISGEGSAKLADRIFTFGPLKNRKQSRTSKKRTVEAMPGYKAAFGYVHKLDNNVEAIDQCVLLRFKAPYSYTGEEQVELQIHGGTALRRSVLEEVLHAGARLAEPGEFSKRAFINGKMDLTQAESVMDLIQAETSRQQQAAMQHLQGDVLQTIKMIREDAYQLLSSMEVDIEYPEYEDFHFQAKQVEDLLGHIYSQLQALNARSRQGKILKEGMQVVLIGEPNVGKSSLLNVLAGEERAIVTEIAGTTRDAIEIAMDIEGVPVSLVDTAGLRDSDDLVERIGVERSNEYKQNADLLLLVFAVDSSMDDKIEKTVHSTLEAVKSILEGDNKPFYLVFNKIDLAKAIHDSALILQMQEALSEYFSNFQGILYVSASERRGIDTLKSAIVRYYESLDSTGGGDLVLSNLRQIRILEEAEKLLVETISQLEHLPLDITASAVRQLLSYLGEITGEDVSEQMVEEIFSRFCIGK